MSTRQSLKRVCVVGLGYVGLPTAALLANNGYFVVGVDIVESIVDGVNKGKLHINEPFLAEYVRTAVHKGNLLARITPTDADIFIITVPTPLMADKSPNIEYVISATESILPHLKTGNTLIIESTCPVGTTEAIAHLLTASGIDPDSLHIAYCPERVLPGNTLKELTENSRIIGGRTLAAAIHVKEFYQTFVKGELSITDAKTAEMTKLIENAYRDVNIAFANELSILCEKFGINVWEIIELANKHPRVNILKPGCGVGGHCIALDPLFIVYNAQEESTIIKTARERNDYKREWIIKKVAKEAEKFESTYSRPPTIACMGLSYKPESDDIRESPALYIAQTLIAKDFSLLVADPHIASHLSIEITDHRAAVAQADIVVFLVAHSAFKKLDLTKKIVIDVCGVTWSSHEDTPALK